MSIKSAIGWMTLVIAFIPGRLCAQPRFSGQIELDLPYIEPGQDGTEKLMTRKLRVDVPASALSDLMRYAHRIDLNEEQSTEIQKRVARIGLDYVVNAHELSESPASDSDKMAKLKELNRQLQEQIASSLNQVLLPHQQEALKKAKFQEGVRMFERSLDSNSELVAALDLTPEQLESLRAKFQENQRRMQLEMQEFMISQRLELFRSVLSEEQMRKLDEAFQDN